MNIVDCQMHKNNQYEIIFDIDNVSHVENFLSPYSMTSDYRTLFLSREWIKSYCSIYEPNKLILVRAKDNLNYLLLEVGDDNIHFIGDPLNDYNISFIESKDLMQIAKIVRDRYGKKIVIRNFPNILLNCNSVPRIDVGLKLETTDNICISTKLLKMYRRYVSAINYERILPENNTFYPLLRKLLQERIHVLKTKNIEGNDFSVNEKFSSFIELLCSFRTMQENIFIDVGTHNDEVVSLGLNFMLGDSILYYLRWCKHYTNRLSYGLMHDLWSIQNSIEHGYNTIDFARGNELYKYRLGLTEYYLYNYEL